MTHSTPPNGHDPLRAIAFLRTDISATPETDEQAIRRYAQRKGYTIVRLMTFGRGANDPTLRLINAMHSAQADAVLIPCLQHLQSTRRAITEQWDLVTVDTETVYSRGFRWPRPRLPEDIAG